MHHGRLFRLRRAYRVDWEASEMKQTELFEAPAKFTRRGDSIVPPQRAEVIRARTADPQTSHDAARSVRTFADGHFRLILDALHAGPLTVSELATATELAEQQINKRLPELAQAKRVEVAKDGNGADLLRPGLSGRNQRVWRLVNA